MPTSPQEVYEMMGVIDRYITRKDAANLFNDLDVIGAKSSNLSFKLSTLMLKTIYVPDGLTLEQKMVKLGEIFASYESKPAPQPSPKPQPHTVGTVLVFWIAAAHLFAILAMILAVPFNIVNERWWVALPITGYILNLMISPADCILTKLEDFVRVRVGMPPIRKFIRHYFGLGRRK